MERRIDAWHLSILRAIYQSVLRPVSPSEVVDATMLADTDLPIVLEGQEEDVCELRFVGRPLFSAGDGEVTDKNCAVIDYTKAWLFEVASQEVSRGLRRELGNLLYVMSLSADLYASRSLGEFQEDSVGGNWVCQ